MTKQPGVEDVAAYALGLNDRKIEAFRIQKKACEGQVKALRLQREAWDELLEAAAMLPMQSKLRALWKLHSGLTGRIDAELKFISGLTMKLEAELEEFSVVQEGIRGQVEQMKAQQSPIVQPRMTTVEGGLKR